MPLPVLETSKHTIEVPSSKKKIEIRPFLVKEEKILLQAKESENDDTIFKAIKDIIHTCSFEKINANELTIYDLEYVFLQLRAISVGEKSEFKVKCLECGKYNDVEIDLTEVKVEFPEEKIDKKIQLNDSVGVVLKHLLVKDIDVRGSDISDNIIASIDYIYDAENVYKAEESSKKELIEFVDSLSHSQLENISKFIQNQPKLRYTLKYNCIHCGEDNQVVLEGLKDFFT